MKKEFYKIHEIVNNVNEYNITKFEKDILQEFSDEISVLRKQKNNLDKKDIALLLSILDETYIVQTSEFQKTKHDLFSELINFL